MYNLTVYPLNLLLEKTTWCQRQLYCLSQHMYFNKFIQINYQKKWTSMFLFVINILQYTVNARICLLTLKSKLWITLQAMTTCVYSWIGHNKKLRLEIKTYIPTYLCYNWWNDRFLVPRFHQIWVPGTSPGRSKRALKSTKNKNQNKRKLSKPSKVSINVTTISSVLLECLWQVVNIHIEGRLMLSSDGSPKY